MPPKPKVEVSPHYDEIIDLLLDGKSSREVYAYLKKEYGEVIGHNAISNYKRNHMKLEEKVEAEANRLLAKKTAEVVDDSVKKKAETIVDVELETQTVASQSAELLIGLHKVASDFPEDYRRMKEAAEYDDSRVTWKYVANMSLQANKISNDFLKNTDVNVNVENNNLTTYFDEEKIRNILYAKRERNK